MLTTEYTLCIVVDMTEAKIKWVSPTGLTVIYEDGTTVFPDEPHPQLPFKDTSNRGKFGLKAAVEAVADDDLDDALAMAS
ncbi:hypothetical protein J4U00_gp120 [Mycobacterium phage DyoEdafos]|uniref:Uncharacterized protein n=1 Tax=Mycobacterium phage DyoEdafos TaxID=2599860 RepID=A0A5J6TKQ5_9CAUD|nr:hypothetical protein J4U00_gp120 [Mycobacterium phage DyoEdafos]QFG10359.1 hypothetical protein SEA_DYOEDAFOS_149 [Mycobacterium phage DyoEdafos]